MSKLPNLKDDNIAKEVITSAIAGNRIAQKAIYEFFYGKMLTVCMRYARNKQDAEDILQDGFVKVFNSLPKFTFKGSFEGWIRRVMINTSIDVVRSQRDFYLTEAQALSIEKIGGTSQDDIDLIELQETRTETIIKLIQKLSPAYQVVFNLYVLENMTHRQIALKLGIHVGTSKSNLFKAQKRIQELLKEEWCLSN